MRKTITLLSLILASTAVGQQLALPRPSPKASLMQTIGLTDMTITYSRPGVKGRVIWGALVPLDKVWRTGANEATNITFSDDVTINGEKLPKGSYSLFTLPGKDEWTIIFNKVPDQAITGYDATKDALRVQAKPEKAEFREWMTFEVPELSADVAKVVLRWENLAVPFTVDAGTTAKIIAGVPTVLTAAKTDAWRTPLRAAQFAFDSNMTKEAQAWLDQSLAVNETISNLWLKARMQQKAGDKAAAIATAEKALSKATDADKTLADDIRKQLDTWKK
jgi:hypothetical protein